MTGSLRSRTAWAALHRLDELGIPHCVLRGHELVLTEPGRDIDLIAPDRALDAVADLVRELKSEFGWDWACRCSGHHEGTSFYFLSRGRAEEPVPQLELHFTRVRWAGFDILSVDELLQHRLRGNGGIWTIGPSHVAVQRILQFGLSGQLTTMKEEYWDDLAVAAAEPGELEELLRQVLRDRSLAEELVRRLRGAEPHSISDMTREMRRSFLRAKLLRPSLRQARGFATAVADRVAGGRRAPRCGVIGFVDRNVPTASIDRLVELTQPMFLRTEIIEESALRRFQDVVNQAGLLLVRSADPRDAAWIPRWKAVALALEGTDLESCALRIIERFVQNHVPS